MDMSKICLLPNNPAAIRKNTYVLQALSIAAVLLAGSCAAPTNDGTVFADGLRNHPITVAPHYETVNVAFSDASAGLSPEDGTKLASFVEDYLSRGDGAISISAPKGPDSSAALSYFGKISRIWACRARAFSSARMTLRGAIRTWRSDT
jgi:type IV pilus biogenesis protein CpaD/CtpE